MHTKNIYTYSGRYQDLAPPNSFIDVKDFSSAKKLAEYLLYLDKNLTAYLSYFQWKKYHHIKPYPDIFKDALCRVCEGVKVTCFVVFLFLFFIICLFTGKVYNFIKSRQRQTTNKV